MNIFNKTASFLVLSALIATTFVSINVSNAEADVLKSNECYPAVLMLRGSAEGKVLDENQDQKTYKKYDDENLKYIQTNGFEGPTISRSLQPFVDQTDPSKTVSKTRFIGVDYPALDVLPTFPDNDPGLTIEENLGMKAGLLARHMADYSDSYNAGAQNVVDFINSDVRSGCDTQYMLVGYSQGVLSARLAMNLLEQNTDKIISSYVIGDPFQKSNGASSSRQKSAASTGSDGTGVYRKGIDLFMNMDEFDPDSDDGVASANFAETFSNADHLIYRDEGENSVVSRSLCHINDLICGFNGSFEMTEHMNYYQDNTSVVNDAGEVDLLHEISEFDKQVQKLANSTTSNPRERVLTKTSPIAGHETVYNVANMRPDDKCSWDYEADGIIDQANIDCGTLNYTHTDETAKMKVVVKDSFGINHILTSKIEVLDPDFITYPNELNPRNWYQFKAYQDPPSEKDENYGWYYDENGDWVLDEEWEYDYGNEEQCIKWNQYDDKYIDESSYRNKLTTAHCWSSLSDKDASDALYAFKSVPHLTASGKKNRVLSGFDDDYSWETNSEYYYEDTAFLKNTSSDNKQDFDPKFARIINDKTYFNFMQNDKCLTLEKDEYDYYERDLKLQKCDLKNNKQLFEAIKLQGDFGSLSVEKDNDAPTRPNNLFVELDLNTVNFNWTLSKDTERNTVSTYQLFKKDNETSEFEFVDEIRHYNILPLDLSGALPGEIHTYKVIAIDAAGNESEASTITFKTPPNTITAPPIPTVLNVSSDGYTVTLKRPEFDGSVIEAVQVFDGSEYVGVFTGETFTHVRGRGNHLYKYRYKISDNVFSEKSDYIRVDNHCSPNCST